MSMLCSTRCPVHSTRRPLPHMVSGMVSVFVVLLVLIGCGSSEEAGTSETQAASEVVPPPVPTAVAPPPDPQVAPPTPQADPVELEIWRSVKDSDDPAELEAYLAQYPDGAFATLARTRMGRLQETQAAAQQAATQRAASPPPARSPRDIVRGAIQAELGGFVDPRLYLAPNIPREILNEAAALHGFDPQRAQLVWADGLGGGAKTGFIVTDQRLYWRYIKGDPPLRLELRALESSWAQRKKLHVNGYQLPVVMAQDSREAARRFAALFSRLAREL